MLDRRLRKLGTLLGLFAIWLIAFAPAISQTLAAHRNAGMVEMAGMAGMADADCPMQTGNAGHAVRHSGHAAHSHASPSPHDALGHIEACAYCGFFAHLPVLLGAAPVVLAALRAAAAPYVAAAAEPLRTPRLFAAQPRAPPLVS